MHPQVTQNTQVIQINQFTSHAGHPGHPDHPGDKRCPGYPHNLGDLDDVSGQRVPGDLGDLEWGGGREEGDMGDLRVSVPRFSWSPRSSRSLKMSRLSR